MTLDEALRAHLLASPGLVALIGDRISPLTLGGPGVTLPALTYQRISAPRDRGHAGERLASPRYQVTVWAPSYAVAQAVAEEVRRALDGFVGLLGGTGPLVTVLVEDDRAWRDPVTGWVQVPIDVRIWYRETT